MKTLDLHRDREEMACSFVAKQVYNLQTTNALIDRLKINSGMTLYVQALDKGTYTNPQLSNTNGKEFTYHKQVSEAIDTNFYFAHPFSFWDEIK